MSGGPHTCDLVHVGAYRIESVLGQGGMGEVFLAWDERLKRHVAIKRIRADKILDEHRRARFRREAQAVARLSHPAIVQVFDILESDAGEYIVMEHVEGQSLAAHLAEGKLELPLAVKLAREIVGGLTEAHDKGLVHRDLKPGNVIVTPSGHAKILDFGLAKALGEDRPAEAEMTHTGMLVGTPHAMSPEQAAGRRVDHRSDLFALGGLLYEMVAGRAPFRGANVAVSLRRILTEAPRPVSEWVPEVPKELAVLVERLMAKDPNHRPEHAGNVADELDHIAALLAGAPPQAPETVVDELPTADGSESSLETKPVIRVLVLTDLVDSTRLVERLGDAKAFELSTRHDRVARDLLARFDGLEIDKSDGFLLLFERPGNAVGFALAYHDALARLSREQAVELEVRVGIHLGELYLRPNAPDDVARGAKVLEVEGLAKPTAARVMSLAGGRQTLLTRGAFDLARRTGAREELTERKLRWLAHGAYVFKGVEEPLDVFEVGIEGLAPLTKPRGSEKAKRVVASADELTLGWRPAAGQSIPYRAHWVLEERLGEGGFGEVWRAEHKSGERRVFKFCFEAARLRALKREVTLFRLLKEALGTRDDIARILDWNFDEAPYFLEAEYTGGGNLVEWAEQQGGLGQVPMETRLELVAEVAQALAAAHSVGILHKDVKPENVLVTEDSDGRPRVRLSDFGIGLLTDRTRLETPGVTVLGFTRTTQDTDSSTGGTLRYLAPELLEGKPATLQADLYSLGVLLYQVVVGDFTRALAPGWKRDVTDPLLCEDIAFFVDGSPERRPQSASEIAARLRRLEERRERRKARRRALEEARRADREAERSRRLRRVSAAISAAAMLVTAVVSLLSVRAMRAQDEAQRRRLEAEDLVDFMIFDLREGLESIGRLDLLAKVAGKAQEYLEDQSEDPDTPEALHRRGISLLNTADVFLDQGEIGRAIDGYFAAQTVFRREAQRDPTELRFQLELAATHVKLGEAREREGNTAAALAAFQAALTAAETLARRHPEDSAVEVTLAQARSRVGRTLSAQGKAAAALKLFQKVVASPEERPLPARISWPYWKAQLDSWAAMGNIYYKRASLNEALAAYRSALSYAERLERQDPANLNWRSTHARCRRLIAHVYLRGGDFAKALEAYQETTEIFRGLVEQDPTNLRWRHRLGQSLLVMGEIQTMADMPEASLASLSAAREVLEDLAADDPLDSVARRRLAQVHLCFGNLHDVRNDPRSALESYMSAWSILEPLARQDPQDQTLRFASARVHLLIGHVRDKLGEQEKARAEWIRASELTEPMLGGSLRATVLPYHVWSLLALGRSEEAALLAAEIATEDGALDRRLLDLLRQHGLARP